MMLVLAMSTAELQRNAGCFCCFLSAE